MDKPTDEHIALWYPRLFRTAFRLTGSVEDAADVTQQAFCQGLDGWEEFDGKAQPTTWLYSILINCVNDWARRKAELGGVPVDPWGLTGVSDNRPDPAEELARREELYFLRLTIQRLPRALRRALIAVVLDGYTYEEAAGLLSVPVGTVASRVSEARQRVRLAMEQRFGEVQT